MSTSEFFSYFSWPVVEEMCRDQRDLCLLVWSKCTRCQSSIFGATINSPKAWTTSIFFYTLKGPQACYLTFQLPIPKDFLLYPSVSDCSLLFQLELAHEEFWQPFLLAHGCDDSIHATSAETVVTKPSFQSWRIHCDCLSIINAINSNLVLKSMLKIAFN